MGHIPVRDGAGRIVDMVDSREAAAAAEEEEAQQQLEASQRDTSSDGSPPLSPDAQRPMEDVLRRVRKRASPSESAAWRKSAAEATIGVMLALAMVAVLLGRPPSTPAEPATIRPSTSTAIEEVQANAVTVSITADSEHPRLARAVVAYAAPEGPVVGALEPGREYTPTGRLDTSWLQLEVAGSGLVWAQAAELEAATEMIARLPDLATPTPQPPPTPEPTPTPAPAPVVAPPAPIAPIAPPRRCTPERVVAIVSDGVTDIWSCVSLADALTSLPGATVIAADPAAAQAYLATFYEQQTAIAPLTQPQRRQENRILSGQLRRRRQRIVMRSRGLFFVLAQRRERDCETDTEPDTGSSPPTSQGR